MISNGSCSIPAMQLQIQHHALQQTIYGKQCISCVNEVYTPQYIFLFELNLKAGTAISSWRVTNWFVDNHTAFKLTLTDLFLVLAHFVLKNNYLVFADLRYIVSSQKVVTVMETSFSVVNSVIFMIWLETQRINDVKFCHYYTGGFFMTSS